MNILVVHLLKSIYKSVFEGSFTLYWHILFFIITLIRTWLFIHLQEMNSQGFLYFAYGFKRKNLTPF